MRQAVNVKADTLRLDRATADDIAFVMATERLPGYERLVGRWSEARHREALADGRHAYFVARRGAEAVGFAIVRDWAAPERVVYIKRSVATAGMTNSYDGCLANSSTPFFVTLMRTAFRSAYFPTTAARAVPTKRSASLAKGSPAAALSLAARFATNW